MRYLILLTKTATGYGAHCHDVDGVIATGTTREETVSLMQEAIEFHFEGMQEDGETIPLG